MSDAYYNENDPFAAQWLRNLIDAKLITKGDVDARSVVDVRPDDLKSYSRCHFFAGIAGWDIALRLADFPADREVWTGSCPCQPFSAAGKAGGFADERHLWPYWFHLVAQRRPATLFGEQVASKAGLEWFDLVWTDLEGAGYAVGVSDLGAASVGAPHIRQRLWFVADSSGRGTGRDAGNAQCEVPEGHREGSEYRRDIARGSEPLRTARDLGHADNARPQRRRLDWDGTDKCAARAASVVSAWSDCDWLLCTDGKARPVEPGTFPLAHGIPGRVGQLRAYGNAVVPQVAAAFVEVAMQYAP